MSVYRTALGKTVDMSVLVAKNERVRAVGNMYVNARGDTIDNKGNVVVPVTKKVNEKYQRSVANRASNGVTHSQENDFPIQVDEVEEKAELTKEELEFENTIDEDLEIEQLKQAETVIKPASEAPDFFDPKAKKTK